MGIFAADRSLSTLGLVLAVSMTPNVLHSKCAALAGKAFFALLGAHKSDRRDVEESESLVRRSL